MSESNEGEEINTVAGIVYSSRNWRFEKAVTVPCKNETDIEEKRHKAIIIKCSSHDRSAWWKLTEQKYRRQWRRRFDVAFAAAIEGKLAECRECVSVRSCRAEGYVIRLAWKSSRSFYEVNQRGAEIGWLKKKTRSIMAEDDGCRGGIAAIALWRRMNGDFGGFRGMRSWNHRENWLLLNVICRTI